MNCLVVKKQTMTLFTVFAERLAMVRNNCDQDLIVQTSFLQFREELSQYRIHICDLTVVRRGRISRFEWRLRIIRIVWIVKVQPNKEWSVWMFLEPCKSAIYDHNPPSLHALVAIFSFAAKVERSVVRIKSAVETGRGRTLGVEHL